MKKISKVRAAKILDTSPMTLALLMQQGKLVEIGFAYKNKNNKWSYIIWEEKLYEYIGVKNE